jgi:co-chaperonin GroES (HSP10)
MEQIPHSHMLPRENSGIADLDPYQNCPLPEDFEIVELLGDVIQVIYADTAEDGRSLVRNGIILPEEVVDNKAWRVGKVVLAGPNTKQVKAGHYVIFPGDKGIKGIQKNGKLNVFLNEERIFGICKPSSI